jgi:hypothetical protein
MAGVTAICISPKQSQIVGPRDGTIFLATAGLFTGIAAWAKLFYVWPDW